MVEQEEQEKQEERVPALLGRTAAPRRTPPTPLSSVEGLRN